MHGKMGGTILINKILNKWGLSADVGGEDNKKYDIEDGRKISFKILDKIEVYDNITYGLFENVLENSTGNAAFKQYTSGGRTYKTLKILDNNENISYKMFIVNELGNNIYEANLQKINSRKKIAKVKIQLL